MEKTKEYKIYTLTTKDSTIVEYVGVTTAYLSSRLSQHVYNSKKLKTTICAKWISSLQERPIIKLIETCTKENWEEREIFWIAFYKKLNPKLKNQKVGGSHVYLSEQRSVESKERSRLAHCKNIYCWLIDGTYIAEFILARYAERDLNLCETSVSKCLKGINSRADKYWFSFENQFTATPLNLKSIIPKEKKIKNPIRQYSLIDTYSNTILAINRSEIANFCNLPEGNVRHYVRKSILHIEELPVLKKYKNKFYLFLQENPNLKFIIKDIV